MIIYQLSQLQYATEVWGAKEAPTRKMAEDNLNIICNFGLFFDANTLFHCGAAG
jgi:hypothetical protein